jgi:hypothetical protein
MKPSLAGSFSADEVNRLLAEGAAMTGDALR